MKRRDLLRHLAAHGCQLLREGARHSWWHHSATAKRSAVPRHTEINNYLARKICRVIVHDFVVKRIGNIPATDC